MHIQDFDDAEPDNTAGGDGGNLPASVPAAVPAAARLVNPFVLFRQRNAGGEFFRGDLIKLDHNTGAFLRTRGENKVMIEPGTQFLVNPHEMVDTWTKRVDDKIVEPRRVYRAADGRFAPDREELGDNDERYWPPDKSGKRKDPWSRQVLLPMRADDDEIVAFSATGQGAIAEVAELVGMYGAIDRHGKFPRAALENRSFLSQHKSKIFVPVFRLVAWQFWEGRHAGAAGTPAAPRRANRQAAGDHGAQGRRRHGRRDSFLTTQSWEARRNPGFPSFRSSERSNATRRRALLP
jgi:hypothetical protein